MAVVMGVGAVMAPAMVMAMVAIPVMVALAMAAIQAPMVLLVMPPRRLHPHTQPAAPAGSKESYQKSRRARTAMRQLVST